MAATLGLKDEEVTMSECVNSLAGEYGLTVDGAQYVCEFPNGE